MYSTETTYRGKLFIYVQNNLKMNTGITDGGREVTDDDLPGLEKVTDDRPRVTDGRLMITHSAIAG